MPGHHGVKHALSNKGSLDVLSPPLERLDIVKTSEFNATRTAGEQ